jgi:MFS family permease
MSPQSNDSWRWVQLGLLAIVELLAMALWFSASSVAPALKEAWNLSDGKAAWLTISVQLGFVVGALVSAVLNLPERAVPQRLMAFCALAGALFTFVIAKSIDDDYARGGDGFWAVVWLRFWTGAMLAGVYPVGMKVMASWFVRGRGLAIGVLVGALTVGSASPHLINALPLEAWSQRYFDGAAAWRMVMMIASASAVVSAGIAALFVRVGPNLPVATRFDWRYFVRVWTEPALRRANFGYLGHMFELYAMWTWAPQLVLASYAAAGWSSVTARVAAFGTVAIGGVGCVIAGLAADRAGRCWTTIVSLVISGGCALVAGSLIDQPKILTVVCMVWGFAVVADSAQFSAAISELCDPQFVGTALTIQTCAGFLLTTLTIRAVPTLQERLGWPAALALLAIGPVFGIYHMARLWRMEEARRMAGGRG